MLDIGTPFMTFSRAAKVIPRHDGSSAKQVRTCHHNIYSDSRWLHAGTNFILPSLWAHLEASRSAQRARAHDYCMDFPAFSSFCTFLLAYRQSHRLDTVETSCQPTLGRIPRCAASEALYALREPGRGPVAVGSLCGFAAR